MRKRAILISASYMGFALYYIYFIVTLPKKFVSLDETKTEGLSCSYPLIKEINEATFNQVQELMNTSFFQTFKINFDTECPFWLKKSLCVNNKCVLKECPEEEIPQSWKNSSSDRLLSQQSLDSNSEFQSLINNNSWSVEGQENAHGSFLSLIVNPESFTGYSGTNIWPVIYKENTFKGNPQTLPLEKRLFNRVISGLHASISTHIAELYADAKDPNKLIPNYEFYFERVANFPDRVENIYYAYSFILKALRDIAPFLVNYNLTSNFEEDLRLRDMINRIIAKTSGKCASPMDTNKFFLNETSKAETLEQIQRLFSNVSQIIECVECEKCRVHAKLQIYGLGTAFKISFSNNQAAEFINLRRNELISLVNTLGKLSESLHVIDLMHERRINYYNEGLVKLTLGFICIWLITLLHKMILDFAKSFKKDKAEAKENEKVKKKPVVSKKKEKEN